MASEGQSCYFYGGHGGLMGGHIYFSCSHAVATAIWAIIILGPIRGLLAEATKCLCRHKTRAFVYLYEATLAT